MSNVVIRLRTDSKQALSELGKVRKAFGDLSTTKGWKDLVTGVGVGVGVGAFNAVTGAVAGLGGALADGVRSAAEEEAAIARLTASLRANVPAWDGNTAAVEETIAARRKLAFSDDELRQSFSTLVAATGNINEAFAVQSTAMDLARFKNIGLAEASDALIKVEAGQYRMLKSLGIELGANATQTEALAAVQKVAGGQQQAYADSAAGAMARLSDSLDELAETLGARLLPVIEPLVRWLTDLAEAAGDNETGLGRLFNVLQILGGGFGGATEGAQKLREEAQKNGIFWQVTGQTLAGVKTETDRATAAWDSNTESLMANRAAAIAAAAANGDIKPPETDDAAFARTAAELKAKGREIADAMAAGLADGEDNVTAAMQKLVDASKNAMPAAQRAARMLGILSSAEVANGLNSGDPYVRAAAQALVASVTEELKILGYKALALGQQTAKMLGTAFGGPGGNQMYSNAALDAVKEYASVLGKFKIPEVKFPDVSGAASAAASSTADLVKQAREAVATLSGLRGMIGQLSATMSAGWTPVVLTAAQAQTNLTAATSSFNGALARLKPGVASTLTAVTSAFGRMKQAALDFYAAQRDARVADLNNAIAAVAANVAAFRNQLDGFRQARQQADLEEAARNARGIYSNALDAEIASLTAANAQKARTEEETRLKLAVTQARTRKDRAAAQAALEAYYARVHLEDLQSQRERQVAVENADEALLDFQQDTQLAALQSAADAQTALLNQQIEAANAQYDAQVSALERIAAAVEGGLETVKGIWDTKNKQALAILNGYVDDFRAAGALLAGAFAEGLGSATAAVTGAASSVTSGATAVVGSATRTITAAATTTTSAATTATNAATTATNAASLIVPTPMPQPTSPVTQPHSGGGFFLHKALGGPVAAGRTYLIGERGPELLTMGAGQSGYVTPNSRIKGGDDGRPVQINLVVDGKTLAEIVDRNLFYKFRTAARTGSAL